jgi:hypothetical protein
MASINDPQFANPAFGAIQQAPDAGLRAVRTSFDRGPRTTSYLAHITLPLRPNETGMQLTAMAMNSGSGSTPLPGMGPVAGRMTDNAWVVDYGRRLGPRFTAGLSVLGHERVGLSFTPPLGPQLLDLVDVADLGARIGATYEWAPGDYLGLIYSYSQDSITTSGVAATTQGKTTFHNNQVVLGASHHFDARWLGVLEFQHGGTWQSSFGSSDNAWHLGAEYRPCKRWALRAGLSDGSPTYGFGYDDGRWHADYAYINDWNNNAAKDLFGGSKTNSLQVACRW